METSDRTSFGVSQASVESALSLPSMYSVILGKLLCLAHLQFALVVLDKLSLV